MIMGIEKPDKGTFEVGETVKSVMWTKLMILIRKR